MAKGIDAMTGSAVGACSRPAGAYTGPRRAGAAILAGLWAARAVRGALALILLSGGLATGACTLPDEAPTPEAIPVHADATRDLFELSRFEPGVYRWPIVKVIDGDTLKVDARGDFPPELAMLNVRLRGVDTPEKGGHAKCEAERRAGRAATAFTAAAVAGGVVTIRNLAWGKYGGRVLADVSVDGRLIADRLIIAGFGRAYDGGKRKLWC